jgi:hypothetical protein
MKADDILSIETASHVIELYEGCLTIDTKKFPDDCVSLTPKETEEVLRLLLIGTHAIKLDVRASYSNDQSSS